MRLRLLLLFLPMVLCAWEPYLEFEGRAGDFRKGGGALMWAPVATSRQSVLFGQAAGGRYIDLWAGSAGGGYRQLVGSGLGVGANIFFDIARSDLDRNYLQGGVGAEVFGPCWIARANGYVPNPNRLKITRLEAELNNNTNEIIEETETINEAALFGGDAEFGYGICHCGNEAWLFAGVYGYNGPGFDGFIGPRVRAEYRFRDVNSWWGAQVVIAGEYQWDDRHRSQGSAILTVRVPLGRKRGKRPCLNICDRMRDPVRRQPAIWALNRRTVRVVRTPPRVTGGPIWFVAQDATGVGTQLDPASINTPFVNAQPGDAIILIVEQTGMDTISMDNAGATAAPYPLLQGSTMAAFGSLDAIRVPVQGQLITITKLRTNITEDVILTTTNPVGNDLINASGNNLIFNFVTEDGERAIVAPAATDIAINIMQIVRPGDDAVVLTNANNPIIVGIQFTDTAARGVVLNGATNATVNFLSFNASMDTLLDVTGGNGVRASAISNDMNPLPANVDAIRFAGTGFTLSGTNNSLSGPAAGTGVGINLTNASNVSLNGTAAQPITIDGFGRGVVFDGGNNFSMTSTPISNSVTDGVAINNATGDVKVTLAPVTMSGANAYNITNSAATVTIERSSISNAAQGYRMAGNTGSVSISDAMIQTITNQGVLADSLTGGLLTLSDLIIGSVGTGIEVVKTDGTSAGVMLSSSQISSAQRGIQMSASTGTLTINANNTTVATIPGGAPGTSFLCTGNGATMNTTLSQLTLTGISGQGMQLGSSGLLSGWTQRTALTGCQFGGATPALGIGEEGIAVNASGAVGTSNCDLSVNGCTFDNVNPAGGATGQVVALFLDGPAGAAVNLTTNISNCGFTTIGSKGIVGTWIGAAQANQTINATIAKNTWTVTDTTLDFIELLSNGPGGLGLICTDINGNSTGATNPSISLGTTAAGAGTINVVAPGLPPGLSTAAQIAANVQSRNTVLAGSVQTFTQTPYVVVQSCPQPTPPQ